MKTTIQEKLSDDILIFAPTEEKLAKRQRQLSQTVMGHGLTINPDKVHVSAHGET